jgi:hypothetical protein
MTAFIQTRDISDELITKIFNIKLSLIALNNMSKHSIKHLWNTSRPNISHIKSRRGNTPSKNKREDKSISKLTT